MNKKLFTLAAALMMGSAFTVNAQSPAASPVNQSSAVEIDGNTYYFLSVDGTNFLYGDVQKDSKNNEYTAISTTAGAVNSSDVNAYLWKVVPSMEQGTPYVQLVNKKTDKVVAFDATGAIVSATKEAKVTKMIVDQDWDDSDNDGVLELPGSGVGIKITTTPAGTTGASVMGISVSGTSLSVAPSASANAIKLYPVDRSAALTTQELNDLMGGSFTFNFPSADPAPASNVFGQKLMAVEIPANLTGITFGTTPVAATYSDLVVGDANPAGVGTAYQGTYFVVSAPDGAIVKANDGKYYFSSKRLFDQCKLIAVDPVNRYDINGFSRANGAGFKFQTIDGEDLKVSVAKKGETALANAHFVVTMPDKVNASDSYLIEVINPVVAQADNAVPSAIAPIASPKSVYPMTYTTLGNSYVMTYNDTSLKNATFAAKLVSSKVIGAADLLKKDGPSVFNIMFTSNQDKLTKANSSEYGKYLAVSEGAGAYANLAQGPAYLDLNAPETQWVVTGFDGTYFTFTNREDAGSTLKLQLSKTSKDGVYGVFAESSTPFDYAYVDSKDGYKTVSGKDLNTVGFEVKLVPATITPNAGYADLTKEDMADPIVMKFTTSNSFLVKDLYVAVGKNSSTGKYELTTVDDPDYAAEWEITKFAAKADSISSKIKYAYMKDKAVATSSDIVNTGITTYAFKWKNDEGVKAYLNTTPAGVPLTLVLDETDKIAKAERQIIKVAENGALLVFAAKLSDNKYSTSVAYNKNALSIDTKGHIALGQNIYNYGEMDAVLSFESVVEVSESLEAQPRHASFNSINGGFLGMDENNDAIIAATKDEAQALTFWLDTTDVKELTTNFYISQAVASEPEAETKAAAVEPRMFLFNPADSVNYYDEGTASTIKDLSYYLSNEKNVKAMFKQATLINKDSINTVIKGKEVGLNKDNGLNNFKFSIVLADDEDEVYAIKSGNSYLTNINGKVGFGTADNALVVKLGEGDATANEAIAAEAGVQVIGGQGVVTVQGAAGKVITVANILGQTIANQVAASDNVTIAVPAGIAVVAVDGEATKVVVK